MSFLSKLLIKSITKTIKSTAKFEIAVDDLIEKFKNSCPPKGELLKIVQQKNQIQSALQNVVDVFSTVQTTVDVTETIVDGVSGAVKIIKAIPVPVSFPPGAGIPLNVITLLADSLDTLGDLLKGAKGAIKVVPSASKSIVSAVEGIIKKLQTLDVILDKCIQELTETGGQNGGPMTQTEKNDLILEIGNVAATAGNNSNLQINIENDQNLINRLNPNSLNPFIYNRSGQKPSQQYPQGDWLLTIEYNGDNEFDFPERRIKCYNFNDNSDNVFRGVTLYNIQYGKYSYSTSVAVLIEEAKFRIDTANIGWYRKNNPNFSLEVNQGREIEVNTNTNTNTNTPGSTETQSTGSSSPTIPIEIIGQLSEIPLPANLGNSIGSTRTGKVITTQPSQSVTLIVDTEGTTPGDVRVSYYPKWGNVNNGQQILIDARKEKIEYVYVYNEPGEYNWKFHIQSQYIWPPLENEELFPSVKFKLPV